MRRLAICSLALLWLLPYSVAAQRKMKPKNFYGFRSSFGCAVHGKVPRRCRPRKRLYWSTKPFARQLNPYFEASANGGASILFGDLGGNLGEGTRGIKDYDPLSTRYVYGTNIRWHPFRNAYLQLNYNSMSLSSSDKYAPNGSERQERNLMAVLHINELGLEAYLYMGEFKRFSFHLGGGGFRYEYDGEAGVIGEPLEPYSDGGIGGSLSGFLSLRVGITRLGFGFTHRSVFHDKLDQHKTHRRDAYGTIHLGCMVRMPKPKHGTRSYRRFK